MILLGGKSLSKLGKDLDGQKYYHKEEQPSVTRRNLEKKINREFNKINRIKKQTKPTFETISREIKSSFTMRNTKDSSNNKYNPHFEGIEPHIYHCKISKTLKKHQFDSIRDYSSSTICRRYSIDSEEPKTNRSQKSLHHIDFDKQSPRKLHDVTKQSSLDPEIRFNNFQSSSSVGDKRGRPFSSYTSRKQLFHKPVHPLMINLRECNMDLFRKDWSTPKLVAFDKVIDKIIVRSDKKIEEKPSQYNGTRQDFLKSQQFSQKSTFISQTERKPNLVKSQYHLRLCM